MPKDRGKIIYNESLGSLMAHTIRAINNDFLQYGIELDVRIIADVANAIASQDDRTGAISLLRTRWKRMPGHTHDRVRAFIYIHEHANRCLARICIAHEIYHLLLEFKAFIDGGRKDWKRVEVNEDVENACNEFAWSLLKSHDEFNKNEKLRQEYMYFPDGLFDNPLTTRDPKGWPKGVGFEPDNPFYRPPKH